jgi:hypothetical protein
MSRWRGCTLLAAMVLLPGLLAAAAALVAEDLAGKREPVYRDARSDIIWVRIPGAGARHVVCFDWPVRFRYQVPQPTRDGCIPDWVQESRKRSPNSPLDRIVHCYGSSGFGWPWPCLCHDWADVGAKRKHENCWAWRPGDSSRAPPRIACIPLRINWWGYLGNSATFGLLAIIAARTWSWLRRTRRLSKGRCFACGYNMSGCEAFRCPECGNLRPVPHSGHAAPNSSPAKS